MTVNDSFQLEQIAIYLGKHFQLVPGGVEDVLIVDLSFDFDGSLVLELDLQVFFFQNDDSFFEVVQSWVIAFPQNLCIDVDHSNLGQDQMDTDQIPSLPQRCNDVAEHKFSHIFLVEQCPSKEHSTDADVGPEYPSEAIKVAKHKSQGLDKSPE